MLSIIADPELMEDEDQLVSCDEIKIADTFNVESQTFKYIYDFGDDLSHHISWKKILDSFTLHAD